MSTTLHSDSETGPCGGPALESNQSGSQQKKPLTYVSLLPHPTIPHPRARPLPSFLLQNNGRKTAVSSLWLSPQLRLCSQSVLGSNFVRASAAPRPQTSQWITAHPSGLKAFSFRQNCLSPGAVRGSSWAHWLGRGRALWSNPASDGALLTTLPLRVPMLLALPGPTLSYLCAFPRSSPPCSILPWLPQVRHQQPQTELGAVKITFPFHLNPR